MPDPPALVLKQIAEISDPRRAVNWILDSEPPPQTIYFEMNLAQVIFDALRPLIRAEIDAPLKRRGSTTAAKKDSQQLMPNKKAPLDENKFQVICPFAWCTRMIHAAFV
jgi:hypothetical protein